MKYYTLLLLVLCLACTQPNTTESSTALEPEASEVVAPKEKVQETETEERGALIYVTQDGDKYHTADCRYSKSAQAISLSQAKADGKTACGICKPNSKTGEKQIRCSTNTAEGKRCQRMTTDSSGKCFQHRDS